MSGSTRRLGLRNRPSVARMTAIAAAIALSTAGWTTMTTESSDGMVLAAEFADASPLINGVDVKVDGVPVGTVAVMTVVDGPRNTKRAHVRMQLDNAALPVHRDATATVRAASLLGERFIDLDRGTASAPVLTDGSTLPVAQTGQATDLDQVLNTFNQPTGQALAELVTALGAGLDGNGENAAAALEALAPAMSDTSKLAAILREQNQLLGSVIDHVQPVASALAEDGGASLDRLVAATSRLTHATAARHRQLANTLGQTPATLAAARRTLAQLAGAAEQTTPTLRALRPTTNQLTALSQELRTFSDSATRALTSAEPLLGRAHRLLVAARPVAAELRKASPGLRAVSGDARPIVEALAGDIGNVLDFIRNWALTTNGHDGISHYFRAQLVVSPEMLDALRPQVTATPAQPSSDGPPLPELPGGLPTPLPGGLLNPNSQGDSATGLTEEQEAGALSFLLGGGR